MAGAKLAKPQVFIGSSGSAYQLALNVAAALKGVALPDPWNDSLELTRTIFDELVTKANQVDFAVFVFQPDDLVERHDGKTYKAVRDNVLFEFGLFLGVLGRGRTFGLMPEGAQTSLPADFGGVLFCTFDSEHPNPAQSVAIACANIISKISELGPRDHTPEFFADLAAASPAIVTSVKASSAPRLEIIASTGNAVVTDVIQKIRRLSLKLTLHLVNPDSPNKDSLPNHWPDESRQTLKFLSQKTKSQNSSLSLECRLYDHIPCVHGIMIDRQELFIGFYRWEETELVGARAELVGAQAPYRRYRRNAATEDLFVVFESWLASPTARLHHFA